MVLNPGSSSVVVLLRGLHVAFMFTERPSFLGKTRKCACLVARIRNMKKGPVKPSSLKPVMFRQTIDIVAGGGGRTRTYEGLASGFTVRPLCRSGHSPLRPMKLASWTKTPRAGRGAGVGLMFPRQPACQLENLSGMRRLQVAGAGSVRRLELARQFEPQGLPMIRNRDRRGAAQHERERVSVRRDPSVAKRARSGAAARARREARR